MREIGSEFWSSGQVPVVFMSGRTALDAIIRDAVNRYGMERVLLPSYCCNSMVVPFLRNHITVRFYPVTIDVNGTLKAQLPDPQKKEALYYMNYFGSTVLSGLDGTSSAQWDLCIADLTHSCLSKDAYVVSADYAFCSWRKWFAVDGIAWVYQKHGQMPPPTAAPHPLYCDLRNKGFRLKQSYMHGDKDSKEVYLSCFNQAEKLLNQEYEGYQASQESLLLLADFLSRKEDVIRKRRSNADRLIAKLKDISELRLLTECTGEDCPIFVPIAVPETYRNELRKYLIANQVYCPIHWSLSEDHQYLTADEVSVYRMELSLICDQRYDTEDMDREIDLIRSFFGHEGV